MAVRVRLTRVGSKKNAMWRVVVADQRSPRDGRFIEMIGHYNPQTEPSQIVIDRERLDHWLGLGAQPSNTVKKLMRAEVTPDGAPAAVDVKPDEGTGGTAEAPEAAPATAEAPEAPAEAPEATTEAPEATTEAPEATTEDGAPPEPDDAKSR